MTTQSATLTHLQDLLTDLPQDSLSAVEQFVQFVRERAQHGQMLKIVAERPAYLYPTVPLPADSLDRWLNLSPTGYDGDALADTEALYDEDH
jgi:hypothetical protein